MYKLKMNKNENGVVDASMGFSDTVRRQIIPPIEVAINYQKDYPTHIDISRQLVKVINSRYDYWQPCYSDGGIKIFTHENGWNYSNIWEELRKEKVI